MEFQEFSVRHRESKISFLQAPIGTLPLRLQRPAVLFATHACTVQALGCEISLGPVLARFMPATDRAQVKSSEGRSGFVCVIEGTRGLPSCPDSMLMMDWLMPMPAALVVSTLLTFQLAFGPSSRRTDPRWPALQLIDEAWRHLHPRPIRPASSAALNRALLSLSDAPLPPFDTTALSRVAGVSRMELLYMFRSELGMSLPVFRKQLRVRMAACALLTEHLSVRDAAHSLGYGSPSQFKNDFTSVFHIAPSRLLSSLTAQLMSSAGI